MSDHDIRRFTVYRQQTTEHHTENHRNDYSEVQYEGVVFTDGTCVLRWRTPLKSTSVWASFEEAMGVHGHPEYGTVVVFHDDEIPLPWESNQETLDL